MSFHQFVLPNPATWRHSTRWAWTVFLFLLFTSSLTAYVTSRVIASDIVDPHLYTNAFAKQQIYDRIYTQLLADPELEDTAVALIGGLEIDTGTIQTVSSFTVSTLRTVMPPELIQTEVEKLVRELTLYLKGKRQRLRAQVNLEQILATKEVQDAIITQLQTFVTDLILRTQIFDDLVSGFRDSFFEVSPEVEDAAIDQFIIDLQTFSQNLAMGHLDDLPASIMIIPLEQLDATQKERVANALLAPVYDNVQSAGRIQVETALAENDLAGAIVMASREVVVIHVTKAIQNLRNQVDTETLDMISSYALLIEQPAEEIIKNLNLLRDVVVFFRLHVGGIAILVMVVSFSTVLWIHSRSLEEAFETAGFLFIFAGGITYGLWFALFHWSSQQITGIEPHLMRLPTSLQDMIGDVIYQIIADFQPTISNRTAYPVFLGFILLMISFLPGLSRQTVRTLEWLSKNRTAAITTTAIMLIVIPASLDVFITGDGYDIVAENRKCNGFAELCDRQFNDVTFAASHNSMSISTYGWVFPTHDGTITEQLEAGVRALLIDTYYWHGAEQLEKSVRDLPESSRITIYKVIEKLRPVFYREGVFLCHSICLLGGTPMEETLDEIRIFLKEHPNEVIILIIQDAISVEDTEAVFSRSGLMPYLYTYDPDEGWLTLNQMIERGQRLVVMAEEGGPPPAWYQNVWNFTEETPYDVLSPSEFTCEPNRGGTGQPLFLLNHWINKTSPSRTDAARINEYNFLLHRAQTCTEERGRKPNFIAVDFYSIGNLIQVVNTLNGVLDLGRT